MNAAWSLSRAKGVCTRKAPSVGLQRHGKRVVHRGPSALRAASDDDIEVSRGGLPLVLPFLSSSPPCLLTWRRGAQANGAGDGFRADDALTLTTIRAASFFYLLLILLRSPQVSQMRHRLDKQYMEGKIEDAVRGTFLGRPPVSLPFVPTLPSVTGLRTDSPRPVSSRLVASRLLL